MGQLRNDMKYILHSSCSDEGKGKRGGGGMQDHPAIAVDDFKNCCVCTRRRQHPVLLEGGCSYYSDCLLKKKVLLKAHA